jgi:hypothetical protein
LGSHDIVVPIKNSGNSLGKFKFIHWKWIKNYGKYLKKTTRENTIMGIFLLLLLFFTFLFLFKKKKLRLTSARGRPNASRSQTAGLGKSRVDLERNFAGTCTRECGRIRAPLAMKF